MKNLKYSLCCFLLLFFLQAIQAEKRGLIIAVGDYPETSGWQDIASTNDVPHLTGALQRLGFTPPNIQVLINQQATKRGIQNAFQQLHQRATVGDMLFLHFSAHGQQVLDDNGDELDRLDEAIVPYDSGLKFRSGANEGQFLIRDDELNFWMHKLRTKIGPNGQVIFVLDACHSGTGTRGLGAYRGTDIMMAPASFHLNPNMQNKEQLFESIPKEAHLAPMASFFGSSPNQLNYETVDNQGKVVGSLSFAISTVLANMKRAYTFQELFDRVKLKMKAMVPNQTPLWEGSSNLQLFGGVLENELPFHNVLKVVNPHLIIADVGSLHNVYEGTKVELLAMNNQVQATGTVLKAGLTTSEIRIDGFLLQHKDIQYRLRIQQRTYPPIFCFLQSKVPMNSRWYAMTRYIIKNDFIRIHPTNPELILTTQDKDAFIQLETRTGEVLYNSQSENIEKHQFQLQQIIKSYMQAKYLKGYQLFSPNLNLSLEVLGIDCSTKTPNQAKRFAYYPPVIPLGHCIKLRITNKGRQTAYFSVLDIQPDHKINLLLPAIYLGYSSEDYYLKPGESYITDFNIRLVEPMGEEVLKLISSSQPIDLPAIMESRGMRNDTETNHPFAKLMAATFQNGHSRGNNIPQSIIDDISVKTYFFKIVQ